MELPGTSSPAPWVKPPAGPFPGATVALFSSHVAQDHFLSTSPGPAHLPVFCSLGAPEIPKTFAQQDRLALQFH